MSFDYGNARVAALRGRLLDRSTLTRLSDCATAGVFVATLERAEDWTATVRGILPLGGDPVAAAEAAIERHRSARLGSLPGWYPGRTRSLVEALVLPLDAERVVALLRRRRAGDPVDTVVATVVPGALLDARTLGRIARTPSPDRTLHLLVHRGVLDPADLADLPRDGTASSILLERSVTAAFDRARRRRARGGGRDARRVQEHLTREAADRAVVDEALVSQGAAAATLLERSMVLLRLEEAVAAARRDPLGIGAVLGYVAGVELGAIRLRAALARMRAGWSPEQVAPYLTSTGGR